MPYQIATWNVLHGIHAVNWAESAVQVHADEAKRIDMITERIASEVAAGSVVCLQEVSGDQLTSLRSRFANVWSHPSARIPRPKLLPGPPLSDPTEHLVVVGGKGVREAASFLNDAGKGLLVVELGDYTLVNTHVTFGKPGLAQLDLLANIVQRTPGMLVITGDFNASLDVVQSRLPEAVAADLSGSSVRTRGDGSRPDIDHAFVYRGRIVTAEVVDVGELSDHRLVRVSIER